MPRTWTPFAALAAAALALAPFPQPAQAADQDVLAVLVGSESEARGRFDAWLGELVGAVARDPESPYALGALWKVRALMGSAADPTVVEKGLEPLLSTGLRDGEIEEQLRVVLSARARARGDFAGADKIAPERGYLRRFAVIGPFGWTDAVLVHRPFPPEAREIDPTASMPGARGPVRWLPLPQLGTSPWITPSDQIRQGGDGVVYAIARIRAAAPRTVLVKAYCRDAFELFVNGAEALLADRERDLVGDEVWAPVRLEAGWNRLLVKVAGRASFALKLTDPASGRPVDDLEVGDPLGGAELAAPTGTPDAPEYRTPAERALAAADPAHGAADASAAAGAAILAEGVGNDWDAYVQFERAAALPAEKGSIRDANVRAAFGRFLAGFGSFPEVQRKLRAKEQFRSALEADPKHLSARVRLAEYDNEDDHPDRALKALSAVLADTPSPIAAMAVARIGKQRGWDKEALDAARAALEFSPNHADAIEFLAESDRRFANFDSHARHMRRLLEINADASAPADALVDLLRSQGRHDEALALVRQYQQRWPAALGWRRQEAWLLRALGRYDESLAVYRALEELVPEDEDHPSDIGEILEIRGDTAGAAAAYRRSLAREAFQPNLWRALERIEGREADFAAGWEPDVRELIAQLPSVEELRKAHPKAVAVTVLDHTVTQVRPDGSATSYVHMVYKLLDEKGVKKYGDVPNSGDLLQIRAIQPDGTVMTPTGLGRRPFNMEGLVPGTLIDHRYVSHQRAGPRGYDGGVFYFQDPDLNEEPNPVMLSRLVVLAPETTKIESVARNFGGEPQVERRDDLVATIWEKRDMPRVEAERFMPPADEVLPLVDASRPAPSEDVNWNLLSQRGDTRPSPILEEAAAKVLAAKEMGDLEKLRALHEYVQDTVTSDVGGREGPTATLLEKAGDRSLLFEALVRIADIPYRHGHAMAWQGVANSFRQPDAGAYGEAFLWLEPRGSEPVPYFGLSRWAPFGLVPEHARGSPAFLADEHGGSITRLSSDGTATQDVKRFRVELGADEKTARVEGTLVFRGAGDYDTKKGVLDATQDSRRKWLEQQMSEYFANPTLESFEFPRLDVRGDPFEIRMKGSMSTYLTAQGGAYVASLGLPKSGMTQRFVHREDRHYDLVLNVHQDRLEEVEIVPGDAFRVRRLPQGHVVFHRLGTYSLTFRDLGDRVAVRRELHLHPARYRPDEYKAFVAWCKSIDDAEERKIEFDKVR